MQGAWSLLISHYSGSHDVVFGAAFSGRPAEVPGMESLIGPCVNNLPVRVTMTPEESLLQWLLQLQQRQFGLAQHQYVPLELIQKWAKVPWRHRLFDSLIVFQNYEVDESACCLGSDVRLVPIATPETTNYPLTIAVRPNRELRLRLIYHGDRFAPEVVQDLRGRPDDDPASSCATTGTHGSRAHGPLASVHARQGGYASSDEGAGSLALLYTAPTTETERAVAALWQELFGVERVSLDDNFFDLGGHSLLLLQAHSTVARNSAARFAGRGPAAVPDNTHAGTLPQRSTQRRRLRRRLPPIAHASSAKRLSRQRSMMEKR